jgi:hypothetical protein
MSFKVKHLGVVLAGCMLAGAAQAQGNQYAKIQLGIADVDGFSDDGVAAIGTFGMTLPQLDPNFSIEGELSFTIDDPSVSHKQVAFGTTYEESLEASYYTLAGYGVYTLPVSQSVGIYGRAGLLYEDVTVEYCDNYYLNGCVEDSENDLGFSFGIGTNIALTKTMDLTANYTAVESDISHLSAGVQFRF